MKRGTGLAVVAVVGWSLACGGEEQPGSDLPNDWEETKDKMDRAEDRAKDKAKEAKDKAKDSKDGKGKKD